MSCVVDGIALDFDYGSGRDNFDIYVGDTGTLFYHKTKEDAIKILSDIKGALKADQEEEEIRAREALPKLWEYYLDYGWMDKSGVYVSEYFSDYYKDIFGHRPRSDAQIESECAEYAKELGIELELKDKKNESVKENKKCKPNKKSLNEGTGNFAYDNRCVLVTDEDFEVGNVPETEDKAINQDHRFPQYPLTDYNDGLRYYCIVLTPGYYEGACIDYVEIDNESTEYDFNYFCEYESDLQYWEYDVDTDSWFDNRTDDGYHTKEEMIPIILNIFKERYSVFDEDDIKKVLDTQQDEKDEDTYYWFIKSSDIYDKLIEKLSEKEEDEVNKRIDDIKKKYGYRELRTVGRFSNGETLYDYIDDKKDEKFERGKKFMRMNKFISEGKLREHKLQESFEVKKNE